MSYEFQNTLFDSRRALCEAIAGAWLSADGSNTRECIEQAIAETPANELVRECIDGYGLSDDWLSDRGIDPMCLYTGFLTVIENPAEAFGWDAE